MTFEQTADTSKARDIGDWAARGQYVVERLREAAKESQADATALLDAAGADYTAYWITNAIRVESGDYALAQALAAQPQTQRVFGPVTYKQPEPVRERLTGSRIGPNADGVVEWGVSNIHADQVWDEYGVRGDGIVVANVDTGVQFDHPALVNSYRGNNGDGTFSNDYNWFDPAGNSDFPTDGNGHGTHTMGTMVGDDGGANRVGVAPGATWIAASGCEGRTCSDASLLAASQWVLAPTRIDGSDPDPAMRPDIINNSWGSENPSNDPFMEDIQQAWADSGMMGVWSNGNSGPGCQSSGSPGSRTLNYSVGAYDSSNTIASFSARGPGQDGEVKPNISAPGVNVRSSFPGNQYATASGTSMAAPHVAGAIALLWSADPSLIGDIAATRQLLDDTAVDAPDDQCGGTADDNNVYGEGRLDVLALVDATNQGETGTVTGTVTHDESGDPVAGASIRLSAGDLMRSTRTDESGVYSINVPAGDYQATVTAFGYESKTVQVSVAVGQTTTTDIQIAAMPGGTVSGTVVDDRSGRGISGAMVTIAGTRFAATTSETGEFAVEHVPGPARYVITIDPPGECSRTVQRSVLVDGDVSLPTVELARNSDEPAFAEGWGPSYGYSCVLEPTEWIDGNTSVEQPPVGGTVQLDLPFPFTYFGEQYRTIEVTASGGEATFDPDIGHSALLVPFGRALQSRSGEILTRVTGSAPNRTFTIEWRDFQLAASLGGPELGRVTFALTLHENGDIVYAYKDLDPTAPVEVGGDATVYLTDHSPNGFQVHRRIFRYSLQEPVLSNVRQIRFELPPNGFVDGHVVDEVTREPVANASVELYNEHGRRLVRKTTDADGAYRLQLMTGRPYSIAVFKNPAYEAPPWTPIELTQDREVRQLTTTLHGGRIQPSDDAITLRPGKDGTIRLKNTGDRQLSWWATTHEAGSTPPPGSEIDSVDVSGFSPALVGGVARTADTWWVGGAFPATLIELDHGHPTGAKINLESVAQQLGYPADQLLWPRTGGVWLPDRGWLCFFPTNARADTIACVDPETSQVRAAIPTGFAGAPTGLAYDMDDDLFYVAGFTDQTYQTRLRTLDGLDHSDPGTVRHTCVLPDDSLGLSYNPTSRTLWTWTRQDLIYPNAPYLFQQLEPADCHVISDLTLGNPQPALRAGAIDEDGNFLMPFAGNPIRPTTISTVQSPDPIADEIPWLQVSMTQGSLMPHRSQEIRVDVDWDAVPEGVTGAKLVFRGNGGARSKVVVPIRLAETRRGTAGSDRIVGTDGPDTILGLGGDDTLMGRGGADRIVGAPGADVVMGGGGADDLYGGRGADRITPGAGVDTVSAGLGADTVHLRRDGKADTVRCGPGRDRVVYHSRRDPHDTLQGCERVLIRS